jgi:hypothetical protein
MQIINPIKDPALGKTILKFRNEFLGPETDTVIWTPTSGKKFVVCSIVISFSQDSIFWMYDETDTATNAIGPKWFGRAQGGSVHIPKILIKSAAINNKLKYSAEDSSEGSVWVMGWEE